MEIKRHLFFSEDDGLSLINYLKKNNIEFEQTGHICTFDILESSVYWNDIKELISKRIMCNSEPIFSEQERESAEWLKVNSKWRFAYPQPENTFITNNKTYSSENKCKNCGCGEVQIAPFRVRKPPK